MPSPEPAAATSVAHCWRWPCAARWWRLECLAWPTVVTDDVPPDSQCVRPLCHHPGTGGSSSRARCRRCASADCPGSSGAVLASWLGDRLGAGRLVVVVATTPADAERWLTDLQHLARCRRRPLPAARSPGRGRAALRDRRRADRNARAAAARRAPRARHHRRASAERTAVPAALRRCGCELDAGETPAAARGRRRAGARWATVACRR